MFIRICIEINFKGKSYMLNLDVVTFGYIYNNCRQIGGIFGFGAFEGFIIYSSLFSLGIVRFLDFKNIRN